MYRDIVNVCAVCEFLMVRPITFGCVVAMSSAVLFILRPRLLLYSAGSGVNRVQVVLSRFSVRLECFVQAKTLCISLLHSCLCDVICVRHGLNQCSGCW